METPIKKLCQRQNLALLRQEIKKICINEKNSDAKNSKTSTSENQVPAMRRRRKTSANLKSFETLSILKDQSISQSFSQFFQLKEKLGEGTQSVVYKCRELSTNKIYTVKIVKQKDLELMYSLRDCYEILQLLDHESIVKGKFLFLNEKKHTCHMVMDYISYPELRYFLKEKQQKGETLDEHTISKIIQSLLDCLCYMNEKGVCHRDIKPENILYDPETGRVKLIDFDIARMQRYAHEKLELWSCTGTPSYRAPETYSRGYSSPVDTWAVGVIAFQMLTGQLPFKTRYLSSTIKKICKAEINYEDYNISSSAKSLLKKLLDKNPQTRISPKEALSHPFILKNERSIRYGLLDFPHSALIKRKITKDLNENTEHCSTPSPNYYEEQMHFSLYQNLWKDIGIRFCQE